MTSEDETLTCATADEFAAWLEANHESSDGVWLVLAKKGTDAASVTRSEALDVALCYGWIDGKAFSGGTPDGWWAQRYTPRRSRSKWSKINCRRVEKLIAAGRMRSAGLAQVESAKADGRWEAAMEPPSRAEVPKDLRVALDAVPGAAAGFSALSASRRYQVLLSVQGAKKPETRARRIARHVEELADEAP
ncbi:YdeI family protein [Embleya sp. NBC_00896]|uniref:YdeI/OmpD-associated family protein n=1 Tax=Embleya sp. NBC_00896 TaxID=2975961 RepID=UPI003863ACB5|nr:YdeI/OmpD-associated family protein [Embleya sp. NBC_00896]